MKATHYKGFIYEGMDSTDLDWLLKYESSHIETFLSRFTKYPCPLPHSFKDGQDVVKGIDYETQHQFLVHVNNCPVWCDCHEFQEETFSMPKRIIAHPIN